MDLSMIDTNVKSALFDNLASGITMCPGPHSPIEVRAPFTGATLGTIPSGQAADMEWAVGLARAAQPAWAARPFRERSRIFLRFHDLLFERQNEILDLI